MGEKPDADFAEREKKNKTRQGRAKWAVPAGIIIVTSNNVLGLDLWLLVARKKEVSVTDVTSLDQNSENEPVIILSSWIPYFRFLRRTHLPDVSGTTSHSPAKQTYLAKMWECCDTLLPGDASGSEKKRMESREGKRGEENRVVVIRIRVPVFPPARGRRSIGKIWIIALFLAHLAQQGCSARPRARARTKTAATVETKPGVRCEFSSSGTRTTNSTYLYGDGERPAFQEGFRVGRCSAAPLRSATREPDLHFSQESFATVLPVDDNRKMGKGAGQIDYICARPGEGMAWRVSRWSICDTRRWEAGYALSTPDELP
ncbi:hypothetical protein VTL71DRAFT_11659 [Oculimacula yallundae]|uniref:Uncharacterized protein n=1 Tax=Oculimacula yallundae TaxID=86028 RepID=A0ABR4CT45_9HELO